MHMTAALADFVNASSPAMKHMLCEVKFIQPNCCYKVSCQGRKRPATSNSRERAFVALLFWSRDTQAAHQNTAQLAAASSAAAGRQSAPLARRRNVNSYC